MAGGLCSLPFYKNSKMGFMMKKTLIILVVLVAVAGIVGFTSFNKNMDEVVGYIDDKAITTSELQNYVDTLLGVNYEKKMDTKEGREELFNHYVNRTLLLEYAKENVKEDDSFVVSHTMGEVSTESALISAILKKEINDKVEYTKNDVLELAHKDFRFKNIDEAEREIISQKRLELFSKLMEQIKSKHKISLAG